MINPMLNDIAVNMKKGILVGLARGWNVASARI